MDSHEISHIIKGVTLLEGIFACRINNASNLVSLNKMTKYANQGLKDIKKKFIK